MADPTTARKSGKAIKPSKPSSSFPLFAHGNGQWSKKIRGRLHYFGVWENPDAALAEYLDRKDELQAGRTPHRKGNDGLRVRDLLNRFLATKEDAVATGEITARTFRDYRPICERVAGVFGFNRLVDDLTAEDFGLLKRDLGKTMAPVSMKTEMQRTRSIFRYAYDARLINQSIRFGPDFKTPSKKVIARARRSNGPRMFTAAEIRLMLDNAQCALNAMIYLAINCGFGNNDAATLTRGAIDLDAGWHTHARPKTQVERRCPLWCETVQAIQEAINKRPTPKDPANGNLVFLTQYGNPWVRLEGTGWNDAVTGMTRELLIKLDIKRSGVNFYALRHTFQTIADEVRDPVAVRFLMGHAPPESDMSDIYRQRISDERLVAVTNHVRQWLFPNSEL